MAIKDTEKLYDLTIGDRIGDKKKGNREGELEEHLYHLGLTEEGGMLFLRFK